ncbi:NAD-dependent malic enzyme [Streptomyces sp. NPDC005962]|uniref:NAD-dependent malic enzyme n=1 Tax=Streptomyces sp. NPDC005962 TaxID=3154466 RepID=UPI003408B6DB
MSTPSPGFALTLRAEAPADATSTRRLAAAVGDAGGVLTALDVVESGAGHLVVDLTCDAVDSHHIQAITDAVAALDGVSVRTVDDLTFLMHIGGKLEVGSRAELRDRDDLSRAYTPGVARVCRAIAADPDEARRLTVKGNTVAVVTDGSAVLGLGNLGPEAALPVMEGKAALFKRFADVDAWPVCLDTQDTDEIVRAVELIAPVYGGVNLEDISAPRCFEIERRLREKLDIPVFHDDQHGTAVVVLAALTNALRVVGKKLADTTIVVSGVGAAGTAIIRLLTAEGAGDIVACDRSGVIHRDRPGLDAARRELAERTNAGNRSGSVAEGLRGADVFIGVSAPDILGGDDVAAMADDAIVFALANPDPEIDPVQARRHATVVATGRSDYPNQINNVLAFPGIFRGLLDAGAREISDAMLIVAARAIADTVAAGDLHAGHIVPSVFDPDVAPAVAAAVRDASHARA